VQQNDVAALLVGPWRRLGYSLIDTAIFAGVWIGLLTVTPVRFPFGFMTSFSKADYDAYIQLMSRMTLALFLLSAVMHLLFGGSIGKRVLGCRTVSQSGAPAPAKTLLARSVAMFLLGLMILAPGPLAAFVIGKGSEPLSSVLLISGIALWLVMTVDWSMTSTIRPTLLERLLDLCTIEE
jgi:uncharacterized RDD family membrane protein YckC